MGLRLRMHACIFILTWFVPARRSSHANRRQMKDLSAEDRRRLSAAEGWISLGNVGEANAELEAITAGVRSHPEVLQVRWYVFAKAEQWEACVDIAATLTQLRPRQRFGWIHLVAALRRQGRFSEAIRVLDQAVRLCGDTPTFAFNLACCHAKVGEPRKAKQHLKRAFELARGNEALNHLRTRALDEPELEPVWSGDAGRIGSTEGDAGLGSFGRSHGSWTP
jgi:Tfp pilus assembly protein PilF